MEVTKLPKDGNQCAECTLLVEALEANIKLGNFTMQSLSWAAEELCENIPMLKVQRDLCSAITASISEITAFILNEIAPKDICQKLNECPASLEVEEAKITPEEIQCAECSLLVTAIESSILETGNFDVTVLNQVVGKSILLNKYDKIVIMDIYIIIDYI